MSLYEDLKKYVPRTEQLETIQFIKDNLDKKYYLLNLPTGVGKSYLALMIADFYSKNIDVTAKVDIITNSKLLQEQYTNTFNSIRDLRGKENYTCSKYSCSCLTGKEFARLNKTKCDSCPYDNARNAFFGGKVSLTNFHLYIIYAIYSPKSLNDRAADILIIDEAHEFDELVSSFISIKVTEFSIRKCKFSNEYDLIKQLKFVKTINDYVEFLKVYKNEIENTIIEIDNTLLSEERNVKLDRRKNRLGSLLKSTTSDVKRMQIVSDLSQLKSKIEVFLNEYELNKDNWVLESFFNEKSKQYELSLEPIWAHDYMDKYVFSRYKKVFFMSGTILDEKIFSELNGLDPDKTCYHSINSPFDAKNRPIYYIPIGKMSYQKKEETFKKYKAYIPKLLSKYNDKRGIIHTNSFELSNWIKRDIKDNRLLFHDSSDKIDMLMEHFDDTLSNSVIVSPSMGTGVSFDEDKARFQIIGKVPYPSLASKKNKMRKDQNPNWYSYSTISGLIQIYGRIVRSHDDYGDTIIIDESFSDILRYSSKLIPDWIQGAIKKINIK